MVLRFDQVNGGFSAYHFICNDRVIPKKITCNILSGTSRYMNYPPPAFLVKLGLSSYRLHDRVILKNTTHGTLQELPVEERK